MDLQALNPDVRLTDMVLSLDKVSLSIGGRQIFQDLSLSLEQSRWTVVLGESGCGKTSLLKLVAGIIPVGEGQVNYSGASDQIAYMAQDDTLMPWLTLMENVRLGARLRSRLNKQSFDQAHDCLESVGLLDRANDLPSKLSGGQRQRVALARTLFENQPLILMDEPFSRLDAITRHELQTMAAEKFQDRTVLLVTHDPLEALRLAHRIIVMKSQPPHITDYAETPFDQSSGVMNHDVTADVAAIPRDLAMLDLSAHQTRLWSLLQ